MSRCWLFIRRACLILTYDVLQNLRYSILTPNTEDGARRFRMSYIKIPQAEIRSDACLACRVLCLELSPLHVNKGTGQDEQPESALVMWRRWQGIICWQSIWPVFQGVDAVENNGLAPGWVMLIGWSCNLLSCNLHRPAWLGLINDMIEVITCLLICTRN